MTVRYTNNARGYLAEVISATDTELTLTPGRAALFPVLPAGGSYNVTLVAPDGGSEIVTVTGATGDIFTVTRGAEDTTPRLFTAGSLVELRVTAAVINDAYDAVTGALTQAQKASELFREYRPGDAPDYFTLTGGALTAGLNGKVYRFTGMGTAYMLHSVPLEPGQTLAIRIYQLSNRLGRGAPASVTLQF